MDNGSTDGSVNEITRQFGKQVNIIANSENVGFAKACNQGMRKAQGQYIALVNSDTVLKGGSIDALVSFLNENPAAAMVGPRFTDSVGKPQNSYDNFPTLLTELFNKSLLRLLFPGIYSGKNPASRQPFEVDSLIGACIIIKYPAIQEVGLLDEDYFFFLEETDWCYRMRQSGWKIYHHPQVEIIHLQGQSKKLSPGKAWIEYYRSLYKFFKKNKSLITYLTLRIFRFIKLMVNFVFTFLALCLTMGTRKRWREKTVIYAQILWWHLNFCPDSMGLQEISSKKLLTD